MTGKARIDGHTREQHVWITLHAAPGPMTQREIFLAVARLGFSIHQIDHHLTRLVHASSVRRFRPDGERRYRYRTVGDMPPDGRKGQPEHQLTPQRAGQLSRAMWAERNARLLALDDNDDDVDNGARGRGVSKGNASDIPTIPTLAELLAR